MWPFFVAMNLGFVPDSFVQWNCALLPCVLTMQERNSMRMNNRPSRTIALLASFAALLLMSSAVVIAQSSDFKLELHANKNVSAAEIGLPAYPGATLAKETDNDNTADLGFTFGDTHFRIMVAKYVTTDTPERVLAFYRKPLSRYGELLECNQGKPVGNVTTARGGLTCSDQKDGGLTVTNHGLSSDGHELRAGLPHQFRIVGIDQSQPQATRFWLVYLELPKDHDKSEKPE
jgi:hypothetical protein